MQFSKALNSLPPYLFEEIRKLIAEKRMRGEEVISLSIGDPDLPTPSFIIEALCEAARDPANHTYPTSRGEPEFRQAVAEWYKNRFGVDVDPEGEVVALIGSKEGIANIARAFINPGDEVLVPDPAYPVYQNGATLLSGGKPVIMPLTEENGFKPDLQAVEAKKPKMMFLNYPNNPTAATADKKFLKEVVDFAIDNGIILCYDNAYSEITYDGYTAPSILEIEEAKEIAIEFHSCSKTFNMTGHRIGFAAGNKKLIHGLIKVKEQIGSGAPKYIQKAAAKALKTYKNKKPPEFLKKNLKTLEERRDILVKGLNKLGLKCKKPKATYYIWLKTPEPSIKFTKRLLKQGVAVTPGIGFGKHGENHVRLAITQPKEKIEKALQKIQKAL